jgi:TPR repeat protein
MKTVISTAFILSLNIAANTLPPPSPPSITWDWYNAAETYRAYKKKGPDDLAIAAHYYWKAANDGNASAAYKLADAFENGIGVPRDYRQALLWYRRAASQKDKYAQFRIGWFYQHGMAVDTNPVEAAKWYRLAADQGNVWAFHMLAFMLADGSGVAKNEALARQYFEYSLPTTNDPWAKVRLAQLISKSDPSRARTLLNEAAKSGNADVQKLVVQTTL